MGREEAQGQGQGFADSPFGGPSYPCLCGTLGCWAWHLQEKEEAVNQAPGSAKKGRRHRGG